MKKYEKSVDGDLLWWYSINCPWDEDKTSKKLLIKLLTKRSWDDKVLLVARRGQQKLLKKVVDKEKQLW